MILSPPMTAAEEQLVSRAGHEVHEFVKKRWIESEWETAWFVNPPVCFHLLSNPTIEELTAVHRDSRAFRAWRMFMFLPKRSRA